MASPDRPRLPEVKAAPEAAVNARGSAYYRKNAVFFYFEADNTGAKEDVTTLCNCFEDVFAIQPTVVAQWHSRQQINMDPSRNPLPSLLVFAYVGHGTIDTTTGKLKLVAGGTRQNIQWPLIHNFFVVPNYVTANVDCLSILDCCYPGATRQTTERAYQVLSTCGADKINRSRSGGGASFSRRFYRAACDLKANEKPFATLEDLVAEINREKPSGSPDAWLTYHGGTQLIAIPFKGTSSASVQQALQNLSLPSPAATTESTLVELSIAGSPAQILQEFQDVIASLPV
ncbi:uncharacterized protein N7515_000696 [Penicillium bovifimosum]|uniref:Uncharacterized protein n=1 Tax=Penicillium bovifimosum TaxID=126998 RepID=A0A9W9HIP7_9EURO|nr:uncharacterized protein N7515_000696 [Penicillium bovifimosum]KAJ5146132.1 hypothetical protein N7515_000696 [Penicillium bovifimosum]